MIIDVTGFFDSQCHGGRQVFVSILFILAILAVYTFQYCRVKTEGKSVWSFKPIRWSFNEKPFEVSFDALKTTQRRIVSLCLRIIDAKCRQSGCQNCLRNIL